MSDSHPGKPLNTSQIPATQGISSNILVPGYITIPNAGYVGGYQSFFPNTVQVDKQSYSCKDVSFQKQSIDYKS